MNNDFEDFEMAAQCIRPDSSGEWKIVIRRVYASTPNAFSGDAKHPVGDTYLAISSDSGDAIPVKIAEFSGIEGKVLGTLYASNDFRFVFIVPSPVSPIQE